MLTDQEIDEEWFEVHALPINNVAKARLFARAVLAAAQAKPEPCERTQLRAAQAAAVMPLIGPLLDAWESCSQTMRAEQPEVDKLLRQINRAMEDAKPEGAKSGPAVAGWQLVPIEPTPTMMNIARGQLAKRNLWGVWKAMLAAAPSAEGGA